MSERSDDKNDETPRTNAHMRHLNLPDGSKVGLPVHSVEFMRQLERELNAARELIRERIVEGSSPSHEATTTLPPKLWLWKNFVDGRPEYWAFDNAYPCHPNGDPITLGEPCGYAIVKHSTVGRTDVPEAEVIAAIKRAKPSATATRTDQVGWLIENGKQGDELRYRNMEQGVPTWTADSTEALRFARRVDAEKFAEEDEDAWCIVENMWCEPPDCTYPKCVKAGSPSSAGAPCWPTCAIKATDGGNNG